MPRNGVRFVLALSLLTVIATSAACGSSSAGDSGSVDQSSLASVASAWANAYHVNGAPDSATLLAIRNPDCPRAQYERYLSAQKQRADRIKLTPSQRRGAEKSLTSHMEPVTAYKGPTGSSSEKLVPLSEVPGSARAVTVHWGPIKINVLKAAPPVTHPFVLINGKWYDGGCPFLSQAKQLKLARGR